ncbi:MAG: DUF2284 domain-containing protein [Bacilli bacterium]
MNENLISEIKNFFDEISIIKTSQLSFSLLVRKACEQNQCGFFDKNWRCPPACGSIEELRTLIQSFSSMLVFTKIVVLQDSFDFESMNLGRKEVFRFLRLINKKYELAKHKMMILGAGSCDLCSPCLYPHEACRYPDESFISLEASGIDVGELAKAANVKYFNGPNTVTYFAAVLFSGENQ